MFQAYGRCRQCWIRIHTPIRLRFQMFISITACRGAPVPNAYLPLCQLALIATDEKQIAHLFREGIPADWLPMVLTNLHATLVDHANLERDAEPQ